MDVQDFRISEGDWLHGPSSSYRVDSFLGEGTFGKVAKCLKTATNEWVAVKIIKDRPVLIAQAEQELAMLERLRTLGPERGAIVRWNGCFQDRLHICLEFELLGMSLLEYLEEYQTLELDWIRSIVYQVAAALAILQMIGIIHSDIKPENIMLVDDSLNVKIIDFGLACHVSQARVGAPTGTTWYKAPELLLGLPYTGAIDVWALGCVALDLFTGYPIYPGDSDYQMVQYIMDTQGPFPYNMMVSGIKTEQFFTSSYKLKSPETYYHETGIKTTENRCYCLNSLDDLAEGAEEDTHRFVDLVKGMLQLEADWRSSPQAVLDHPFSTSPAVAVVGRHDNAGHLLASQDQSSCGNTSVGTKVALLESLVSKQPLSSIKRKRGETDSAGNRKSTQFSLLQKRQRFDADTNRSSSVTVTEVTLNISERSMAVAEIQPVKSWIRRLRRFLVKLLQSLCCCCPPSEELS
ncbi:homeodomain-interacting protein kinase 2-like [Gadus macrocephalus]|uniref:homeodomain-interacting protein kinase 2-like n=1 Tax=Gadus macrocephalus TaxID=80720 RepID=UPI0028CB247A|nr:homeodomain-interacting protein kinase 2-like [Gadus macrocephalus]